MVPSRVVSIMVGGRVMNPGSIASITSIGGGHPHLEYDII